MKSVSCDELIQTWLEEEERPFTGWDFSYLDGRMIQDEEPWSYLERAADLMRNSTSVLDMDTGGGEKLLSLGEHCPTRVVATEDYPPNFELATERLSAMGAEVVKVAVSNSSTMPFDDGEFDLVLNRHAAFNSSEVERILSGGGTFLTQQVHGMWAWDLMAAFDAAPQWPDATPELYVPLLEAGGMAIETVEEWEGSLTFTDVGTIVYYLKAIPWEVPGFTVNSHLRYLLALQERVDGGEKLEFYAAKYLIEATKV